ncbi:MAG: hypothetical protein IJX69_01960 [Oscillospiraceae bacterium]|nr:hypothetical protein [Oscillospiraceae bacterium]
MGIVIVVFIVLISLVIFSHSGEMYRSHKRYAQGIVNHDPGMKQFCYRVDKSELEIREALRHRDVYTATKYRFDAARSVITFYSELPDGYLDTSYLVQTAQREGYTILVVTQLGSVLRKNKFLWLQNEFWHQKLEAAPITYTKEIYDMTH